MVNIRKIAGVIFGCRVACSETIQSAAFESLEQRRLLSATSTDAASTFTGIKLHEKPAVSFSAHLGTFTTVYPASELEVEIDWGDGSSSVGTLVTVGKVGKDEYHLKLDGTHSYAEAGKYEITATAVKPGPAPTTYFVRVAIFSDRAIVQA